MIYPTAYDTTACKGFITSKLVDALEKVRLQNYLMPNQDGYEDIFAVTRTPFLQEAVSPFVYPVSVKIDKPGTINDELYVYFDARPYMRTDDKGQNGLRISNTNGYNAARAMAIMQKAWLETPLGYMKNLSSLPLSAYCSWMGDNIAKRYALEPGAQQAITILAGVFYLNLFLSAEDRVVAEKVEMVSRISKATGFKHGIVQDIVNDRARIDTLDEYCQICLDYTGSTRLRDLNAATVFNILGGTWYGANSRELVSVATECPWLWMVMLFSAYTDRGYHHAGITKMLDRSTFKKQGEQYTKTLPDYLGSFKMADAPPIGYGANMQANGAMIASY